MNKLFLMFYLCCLLLLLLLQGCAGPALLDPQVIFKADMKGTVNGIEFDGAGVIPFNISYLMEIESRSDVDLLTVTSCHRDFSVESAIKQGWFAAKRGYSYTYNPTPGIENTGSCLLRIGAYDKGSGRNAWAILDFQTPDETMPAIVKCNGVVRNSYGVSICQSRAGLVQRIEFPKPVEISAKAKCQIQEPKDLKTWEYTLQSGECVFAFREIDGGRLHRHTTIGYEQIPIRGE